MFAAADITGKGSTSFTPSMRRCTVLARFRNLEIQEQPKISRERKRRQIYFCSMSQRYVCLKKNREFLTVKFRSGLSFQLSSIAFISTKLVLPWNYPIKMFFPRNIIALIEVLCG